MTCMNKNFPAWGLDYWFSYLPTTLYKECAYLTNQTKIRSLAISYVKPEQLNIF